jgi:GT2 family glycosyltransferase
VPRVSLLIPTYSRPDDLHGCIEAALASSYEDIEVVVGDDGSAGAQVCESFHDGRLRYVANPRRLGMAGNWNSLLDGAEGDLLSLCMDDDRIAPTYVAECVAAFDGQPDLGVVFTNHVFADRAGQQWARETLVAPGRHEAFARAFVTQKPVAVSAAMIRRSSWRDVRPLPDTAAADMVLFGRIAERGWPFYYIDMALMTYRTHDGMLSSTPGFRTDVIAAWSSLHFSDVVAEHYRCRRLGEAFLSRANLSLQQGDRPNARADLACARHFGIIGPAYRLVTTGLASLTPTPIVSSVTRLRRRARALRG